MVKRRARTSANSISKRHYWCSFLLSANARYRSLALVIIASIMAGNRADSWTVLLLQRSCRASKWWPRFIITPPLHLLRQPSGGGQYWSKSTSGAPTSILDRTTRTSTVIDWAWTKPIECGGGGAPLSEWSLWPSSSLHCLLCCCCRHHH